MKLTLILAALIATAACSKPEAIKEVPKAPVAQVSPAPVQPPPPEIVPVAKKPEVKKKVQEK